MMTPLEPIRLEGGGSGWRRLGHLYLEDSKGKVRSEETSGGFSSGPPGYGFPVQIIEEVPAYLIGQSE